MTAEEYIPELKPGDVLLYGPSSIMGYLTSVKTWSNAVHVEMFVGEGKAITARSEGVNIFPLRTAQLIAVLRPNKPIDIPKAMEWFNANMKGQKYDWKGLLIFTLAVHQGAEDKAFCSETVTRVSRNGDFQPFNPRFDADKIAPASFYMTPSYDWVWIKE